MSGEDTITKADSVVLLTKFCYFKLFFFPLFPFYILPVVRFSFLNFFYSALLSLNAVLLKDILRHKKLTQFQKKTNQPFFFPFFSLVFIIYNDCKKKKKVMLVFLRVGKICWEEYSKIMISLKQILQQDQVKSDEKKKSSFNKNRTIQNLFRIFEWLFLKLSLIVKCKLILIGFIRG